MTAWDRPQDAEGGKPGLPQVGSVLSAAGRSARLGYGSAACSWASCLPRACFLICQQGFKGAQQILSVRCRLLGTQNRPNPCFGDRRQKPINSQVAISGVRRRGVVWERLKQGDEASVGGADYLGWQAGLPARRPSQVGSPESGPAVSRLFIRGRTCAEMEGEEAAWLGAASS